MMVRPRLEPTVTIGGAPAGYKPTTSMQPTVTIGGAPAGYTEQVTPNFITGENIPGVDTKPPVTPPETPLVTPPVTPPVTTPASRNTSAFDLITLELKRNGLESLVVPLTRLFQEGIDDADTLRLRLNDTPEYKARFSANATRVANGLRALSPAEYTQLEDQYQEVMRNYGLPSTYWTKDATGKQAGFDQLLAGDVSAVELEDRVATAKNRVMNASTEIKDALKTYYGDVIKDGDILAYALDPKQALNDIKRKVTAAEIGGSALMAGLNQVSDTTTAAQKEAMRLRSEEIAAAGVTKEQAQQQYGTIAELAQRGGQLADIYKQQPYGQAQAEAEAFNLTGQTEAAKQRKKIRALETAAFSGSSGAAKGALERERVSGAGAI